MKNAARISGMIADIFLNPLKFLLKNFDLDKNENIEIIYWFLEISWKNC